MKIACIGGGPGGLYFSILMKKAFPAAEIAIHERQARGETFGWGVVFSDETMAGFREDDPQVVDAITDAFAYWRDIDTYRGGIGADEVDHVRSTGHGFCGMSRIKLLGILEDRAVELGVEIHHGSDITDPADLGDVDLILASDGINSATRERHAEHFRPYPDPRPNHFCWLGTDRPLEAFTFVFKENEHGLFCVHAYPYQPGTSTWIVECQPETFEKAGLGDMTEDETVAYMQRLFERDLQVDGHQYQVLGNKSIWRQFPTIRNERASELGLRRDVVVEEPHHGLGDPSSADNPYGYGVGCPDDWVDTQLPPRQYGPHFRRHLMVSPAEAADLTLLTPDGERCRFKMEVCKMEEDGRSRTVIGRLEREFL